VWTLNTGEPQLKIDRSAQASNLSKHKHFLNKLYNLVLLYTAVVQSTCTMTHCKENNTLYRITGKTTLGMEANLSLLGVGDCNILLFLMELLVLRAWPPDDKSSVLFLVCVFGRSA
jgi:hypothetical protein